MGRMRLADAFASRLTEAADEANLHDALMQACRDMGFHYFALSHHIENDGQGSPGISSHNYPPHWAEEYDDRALGSIDPVRRASERAIRGFAWSDLSRLITLNDADHATLERGFAHGIGDGFTVPANIPGEVSGSCSFALKPGEHVPKHNFGVAQLIGTFAFEAARHLQAGSCARFRPGLTQRQRDCVLWVARGKSDWEISKILGISHDTVIQHLKLARERYGVDKRTSLVVRALFDGILCFADILRPRG